jgi:murein DD-endopeptidase MepM/ murein hydrolase activator NlpD
VAAGRRYSAGRIFLQVVPSFKNLQDDIGRQVKQANRKAEGAHEEAGRRNEEARQRGETRARKVGQERELSDLEKFFGQQRRMHSKFHQGIVQSRIKVALAKQVEQGKARARAAAERERQRLALQGLKWDIANTNRALREQEKAEAASAARSERARDKIRDRRIQSRLRDMRAADAERERVRGGGQGQLIRKASRAMADTLFVKLDADSTPAERKVAALRERLLHIDAHIGVDMDAGEALAEIKLVKEQLDLLARKHPDVKVEANVKLALLQLHRVEEQIDQINHKKASSGFLGMFAGAAGGADQGANSFRIFNYRVLALVMLLPTLAPLLGSAAGALGAIGTAAIGGAAGLGVMIAGFTGLADAVTAMGEVHDNARKDALANDKAMRTASRGVRDASQSLARARSQAARAAEDSDRRIADAERNLADAQRDAKKAQDDLAKARADAQKAQDDLADRIASGKLDERQALIDLFNAQVDYNNAMADGSATNLEREQASIQLERARLNLKGVREENKALADQQKKGVKEDANVVAAQEKVVDTARRVKDAQQGVADAQRDQRQQAQDSADSIRDAQERLSDAQTAYQEALTKTGDIGQASMQKLQIAMGKLGPEGREFARFLFGLQTDFIDLRNIIQAGMLPPLQREIKKLMDTYGPDFKVFLSTMGTTVGQFFTLLGETLRGPDMRLFFETMAKYAPTFFTQFGDLFVNLLTVVANLATAFAPFAKEFMDGFVDMTKGWAEWSKGLIGSDGFNKFLDYVRTEGPQVLELIFSIAKLILNIGKGMADTPIFDAIVGFFKFIAGLDPKIVATLFTAITGLAFASQVAAGVNALAISVKFLMTSAMGPWVLGITAVVIALVWLYNNNENFRKGVQIVWAKVQEYVGVFVDWIKNSFLPWWQNKALPAITGFFQKVAEVAQWLWQNILQPVFTVIGGIISKTFQLIWAVASKWLWPMFEQFNSVVLWLWEHVLSPVFGWIGSYWATILKGIKWYWDNVLSRVFDALIAVVNGDLAGAWQSILDIASSVWNQLGKIVAEPVNFIIGTVLNDGLFKGINDVLEFLGLKWRVPMIDKIQVNRADPNYSYTGVASKGSAKNNKYAFDTGGYTGPGGKYEPAGIVHRDEYVLRKEATTSLRKIIGLDGLDFINRYGVLPGMPGYAIGGMVKPVNAQPRFPWGHYPSGKVHRALDLPAPAGTPIVSPFSGRIIRDGWDNSGFGNHVRLAADNGTFWILGHMLREIVSVGQRMLGGQLMGYVGSTGHSTGNHLHLEGRMSPYDPNSAFNFTAAFNGGVTKTPPVSAGGQKGLPWWADKPLEMLRGVVNTGLGLIPWHGGFIDMLKGVPNKIFDGVGQFLGSYFDSGNADLDDTSGSGGKYVWNGREVADNGSMMFDRGGLLQPGVTQVLNMTGRPEPVFTADQWAQHGGEGKAALIGRYEPHFHDVSITSDDVAQDLTRTLQRVSLGGKYAGRTL